MQAPRQEGAAASTCPDSSSESPGGWRRTARAAAKSTATRSASCSSRWAAAKLYEAGAAPVAGGRSRRGVGGAHAVAQRERPAYCRGGSAMSVATRIRRSVRAVNLHNGWVRVLLCSAVALVVAVGLLDGVANGVVIMFSVVAALFAATQLLDCDDVRRIEQTPPSTFGEKA